MNTFEQVNQYVISKGANLEKMNMEDICVIVHNTMYRHLDSELKAYLTELIKSPTEFTIPHSKLVYFGVISKKSGSIVNSLAKLGAIEEKDYVKIYDGETKYMFTPRSFKYCLMSSRPHPRTGVDFMDYFFFHEDCFALLRDHEAAYNKALK